MTSRADQHDIDKLGRWHRDLTGAPSSAFPVYAIFLVSADDRLAHDIFRQFRTSFEARSAGFANLVIFGQHGVSTTVHRLLPELGLPQDAIPTLALLAASHPARVYSMPLPPGSTTTDGEQPGALWRTALARVEAAVDSHGATVDLAAINGLTAHQIADATLAELVEKLIATLS